MMIASGLEKGRLETESIYHPTRTETSTGKRANGLGELDGNGTRTQRTTVIDRRT